MYNKLFCIGMVVNFLIIGILTHSCLLLHKDHSNILLTDKFNPCLTVLLYNCKQV